MSTAMSAPFARAASMSSRAFATEPQFARPATARWLELQAASGGQRDVDRLLDRGQQGARIVARVDREHPSAAGDGAPQCEQFLTVG